MRKVNPAYLWMHKGILPTDQLVGSLPSGGLAPSQIQPSMPNHIQSARVPLPDVVPECFGYKHKRTQRFVFVRDIPKNFRFGSSDVDLISCTSRSSSKTTKVARITSKKDEEEEEEEKNEEEVLPPAPIKKARTFHIKNPF